MEHKDCPVVLPPSLQNCRILRRSRPATLVIVLSEYWTRFLVVHDIVEGPRVFLLTHKSCCPALSATLPD